PYIALVVFVLALVAQYSALASNATAQADALNTQLIVIFAILAVVSLIAWLVALSEAKYRQRWGWFAVIFFTLPLALISSFVNNTSTASTSSTDAHANYLLPYFGPWTIGLPLVVALTLSVLFHTARHGR